MKDFLPPKMQLTKLKILLLGPSGSGKTLLANFISDAVNVEEAPPPTATKALRIVEFELRDVNFNGKNAAVDIELWDCSGDHRYESCWPALRQNVQGVILACSPSTSHVASKELELMYNYFVSQPNLTPKQCVLFYNCSEEMDDVGCLNLSSTFNKVSQVAVNLKTGGNRLKIDFNKFITSVLASVEDS